jgi:hypothetical protein
VESAESSVYNGKFEMTWKFDLAKVAAGNGGQPRSSQMYVLADPLLGGTGTISPVNTAAIVPDCERNFPLQLAR